jgi:hypothetical protein
LLLGVVQPFGEGVAHACKTSGGRVAAQPIDFLLTREPSLADKRDARAPTLPLRADAACWAFTRTSASVAPASLAQRILSYLDVATMDREGGAGGGSPEPSADPPESVCWRLHAVARRGLRGARRARERSFVGRRTLGVRPRMR